MNSNFTKPAKKRLIVIRSFYPILVSALFIILTACETKTKETETRSATHIEPDRGVIAESTSTNKYKILVLNPECVPGECICVGQIHPEVRLNETGPRSEELRDGVPCIAADFDGNGFIDIALPGAEGMANIIMNNKDGYWKAVRIDAGGFLELYSPRDSLGGRGQPKGRNYGLLVRWVGQNHAVFMWDGNGFKRTLLPAK